MTKVKNRDLKKRARILLTDRHSFFALVTVILFMSDLLLSYIVNHAFPHGGGALNEVLYWAASVLTNMVFYLILAGAMGIYLDLCRGQQCRLGDLWSAFSFRPEQVAVYSVLQFVLQTAGTWALSVLWSLNLLSATGAAALIVSILLIIAELGLSMSLFIYCDDRYKSAGQMIRESWQMMRGNKLRLLGLELSFIGVMLLGVLSLGIGFLFVRPYMYATQCLLYLNICENSGE